MPSPSISSLRPKSAQRIIEDALEWARGGTKKVAMGGPDDSIQNAKEMLFLGDDSQRMAAIEILYRAWYMAVAGAVRRRMPGLTSDRLASAVNDAFLDLLRAAEKCDYDPECPEKLLFTVAIRRGVDAFRSQTKRGVTAGKPLEDSLTAWLEDMSGCDSFEAAVQAEVGAAIREWAATLPPRQRLVAQMIAQYRDGIPTPKIIQEMARELSCEYLTLPAAKRALEEVRRKMRLELGRFNPKNE